MSAETSGRARTPRGRKIRNALLAVSIGVVLALVAGETVLRLYLFHPKLGVDGIGDRIRQPQKYFDGDSEDAYWRLRSSWQDQSTIEDAPNPNPVMGWTGSYVKAGTYEHPDEPAIRGRKLVLLYGDSFAQCNTPPEECFQAILARSELAQEYALLNYGVGGYGLDQIYLMLRQSVDRFAKLDPIVIVAILVESDFDRSVLAFRDWPKPRLHVVDDELVATPVQTNTRKYLADNPVSVPSFLWRFLLFHPARFLTHVRERLREPLRITPEKQRLSKKILFEIEHELSRRKLRHFFLVFHAEQGALQTWELFAWQDHMVADVCAELSIPIVDTRPYLKFASGDDPEQCARFYGHSGPLTAHHNAVGNLICFEAIRQGLRGDFGAPDFRHLADLKRHGLFESETTDKTVTYLLGRPATLVTHGAKSRLRATQASDPARLLLRGDAQGSTRAEFDLAGDAKRLRGVLHSMVTAEHSCEGVELSIAIEVDGASVLDRVVPPSDQPTPIDIDLSGKRTLAITVRGFGGTAGCDWVCIEDPHLE